MRSRFLCAIVDSGCALVNYHAIEISSSLSNCLIETRVEVWENEKCCGNTSHRRVFPQLFRVLSNFHECFYSSVETRSTCFLFFFRKHHNEKKENNLLTLIIKMTILFARIIIRKRCVTFRKHRLQL